SAVEPLAREELSRRLLSLDPDSFDARLLLVHALLEQRRFDSARAEIQPLLDHGLAAREEVQAALAEIDVGTGRFQEAIQRYERLVRTGTHPHYRARLEQIKELWQEANLPPRYRQALASPALTRAEAAILAYWRVSAVRFAQNLPPPPIAVDLAGIAGREELVRALALGLFPIDPLTRRADPSRTITADRLMRLGATLLSLHPRPACVSLAGTGVEKPTSMEILRACNVDLGNLPAERDRFVSGEVAVRILDQIDDVLHSAEQSQAGQ
ncbi:MAG TPA: tetratricopeptide repeat protein, partial [Thermoanaerobaculia bacterium]|nr:tetratricopeptide repeat protein [Thermoanaerobaculia bacterium]